MEELFFDEEKHIYYLKDGERIPSTTQVLKDTGLGFSSDFISTNMVLATELGTKVHKVVEDYNVKNERPNDVDTKGYFSSYMKWVDDYRPTILSSEERLYYYKDNIKYAGTLDISAIVDGKKCIIDLKTGVGIYKTYAYQLAAYLKLYNNWHNESVKDIYILQLRPDGEYVFMSAYSIIPNCIEIFDKILIAYSSNLHYIDNDILDENNSDILKWLAFKEELDKINTQMKRVESKIRKSIKHNTASGCGIKYKYSQPDIKESFNYRKFLQAFENEGLFLKEDIVQALEGCTKLNVNKKGTSKITKVK